MVITKIKKSSSALDAGDIPSSAVGNVTATDVQAAIAELDGQDTTIQGNVNTIQSTLDTTNSNLSTTNGNVAQNASDIGDNTTLIGDNKAELAAVTVGKGASLIGVHDVGGNFTATEVEAVLAELAASISSTNADLLDGQHGAYYLALANATGTAPTNSVNAASIAAGVVAAEYASTASGAVGTYRLLILSGTSATIADGATRAGSGLMAMYFESYDSDDFSFSGLQVGTWRNVSGVQLDSNSGIGDRDAGLWLRIS